MKRIIGDIAAMYGISFEDGSLQPMSGGDISDAYTFTDTNHLKYVIKHYTKHPYDLFEAEAVGLKALASFSPPGLLLPHVLGYGSLNNNQYLILEFIEHGQKSAVNYQNFGTLLARLHKNGGNARSGFPMNNYIGATHQINTWQDSWVDFYRVNRLEYQFRLAVDNDQLDDSIKKDLSHLIENLEQVIEEPESLSLLHGDLWGGNHLFDKSGKPVLLDPAVYYGDREADLAMTEVFGSFPEEFYTSYKEEYPLSIGYARRKYVYQLYHALNHVNLFGGGYLSLVSKCLKQVRI